MISVILLMAGSSTRMQNNQNKLFLPLGNKMVFEHALDKFLEYDFEVICVTKEEYQKYLTKYKNVKIVYGGKTRQESVYNGLKEVSNDYVFIHDAARPFIYNNIINECLKAYNEGKAFIVGRASTDSVYMLNPFKSINRNEILLAQTPQGAKLSELLEVHKIAKSKNEEFTDDISMIIKYGTSEVKIIDGGVKNFKITTQLDYIMAKEIVKNV